MTSGPLLTSTQWLNELLDDLNAYIAVDFSCECDIANEWEGKRSSPNATCGLLESNMLACAVELAHNSKKLRADLSQLLPGQACSLRLFTTHASSRRILAKKPESHKAGPEAHKPETPRATKPENAESPKPQSRGAERPKHGAEASDLALMF